jgi:hypothetical protein
MKEICVVYLARAQNGIEPFRNFLESYRQNQGGIEHDFMVVFKGFECSSDKDAYFALLAPFQYVSFDVPDIGFDLTAYFATAEHYAGQCRYFCFLNSFSVILCHDWLSKLYKHISRPEVGLVGATGSWQSLNPWGQILQRRRMLLNSNSNPEGRKPSLWEKVSYKIVAIWRLFYIPLFFSPFPNYHLRTNAFMVSRALMMKIVLPTIKSKLAAYKFESGKNGLTRQVINMSKEVLVVGEDGVGYKMKDWNKSNIYWQADQQNLLVADNQTRSYQNGAMEQRRYLSVMAWGGFS